MNGTLVIDIGGTAANPTFALRDKAILSPADLLALRALFAAADVLLGAMDAILAPSYWVFDLLIFFPN